MFILQKLYGDKSEWKWALCLENISSNNNVQIDVINKFPLLLILSTSY